MYLIVETHFFVMDIKYRIRRRQTGRGTQYYVDYKRPGSDGSLDGAEWMGGFYAGSEEEAREIIDTHREYETLRLRLQMDEEVIYDETEEKK